MDLLKSEIAYLTVTMEYPCGYSREHEGREFIYELFDLTIDKDGYLLCYLSHIGDYYYVSDELTALPNKNSSKWIDYIYYRDKHGEIISFKTHMELIYAKR